VLLAVERPAGPTLTTLLNAPDTGGLDARERGFLHELAAGTLRRRGSLDAALAARLDRPLDRVDPPVRAALRLGAYQLLFTRVPPRAAVAESVELAPGRGRGFVNAVLRAVARDGAPPAPDAATDARGWLTTEGSLPAWLAERWLARLGPERTLARARAWLAVPPVHFRFNPRRADSRAEVEQALRPRPLAIEGAFEATAGDPAPWAERGAIYVQDLGAQLVARLAEEPGRVLDACAAPGGKALLLADAGAREVVAAEAAPARVRTLQRLVERWGASEVRVVQADATRPPFAAASFDVVLVDAPCSGLGTLGRHPDIRWRATAADLTRHAARQGELLSACAGLVRPGGRLVYATCSTEPEENEQVVADLLAARAEFHREPPPGWASAFADGEWVRATPEAHGSEAFFAAVLRRRTDSP
jgi:16S rRNA (cytosine967-C5)-methyltransferase